MGGGLRQLNNHGVINIVSFFSGSGENEFVKETIHTGTRRCKWVGAWVGFDDTVMGGGVAAFRVA